MNLQSTRPLVAAVLCAAAAGAALAQGAADMRGAYLAANCANCHGTNGRSLTDIARLAGQPKETTVKALREFRDGRRVATIMHQLAKGYSDEQFELMAEFFARQPAR